jgi:hypothetical protein
VPLSLVARIGFLITGSWNSQSAATPNYRDSLEVASEEFAAVQDAMQSLATDLEALQVLVEAEKAPWTPGRIPELP